MLRAAGAAALLLTASAAIGAAPVRVAERDVSNARGAQVEATIAVDPRRPNVLLAASNSYGRPLRVYSSTDGGRSWSSQELPAPPGVCDFDPSVGIDAGGRQYVSFIANEPHCYAGSRVVTYVAHRTGPNAPWVIPHDPLPEPAVEGGARVDDKPWLVVDAFPSSPTSGRVYVVFYATSHIVLTHSDDGGLTWSPPAEIDAVGGFNGLAVAPDGALYLSGVNGKPGSPEAVVTVGRSTDGGLHVQTKVVFARIAAPSPRCGVEQAWVIPAQHRCITPLPSLAVDSSPGPFHGRVYLTFENLSHGVVETRFLAFTPELARAPGFAAPRPVAPPPRTAADRFLPALVVDQSTGAVVVCFYVTPRGRNRGTAVYSCARSTNGGLGWTKPVRAASRTSNENSPQANYVFQYGDYEGVAASGGAAHPIWTDSRKLASRGEEIYTSTLRWPAPR